MADDNPHEENIREALNAVQISRRFGRGENWWYENQDDYIANRKFPPPLPGVGRKRWSRRQVERWFATGGETYAPAPAADLVVSDRAFDRRLFNYAEEIIARKERT